MAREPLREPRDAPRRRKRPRESAHLRGHPGRTREEGPLALLVLFVRNVVFFVVVVVSLAQRERAGESRHRRRANGRVARGGVHRSRARHEAQKVYLVHIPRGLALGRRPTSRGRGRLLLEGVPVLENDILKLARVRVVVPFVDVLPLVLEVRFFEGVVLEGCIDNIIALECAGVSVSFGRFGDEGDGVGGGVVGFSKAPRRSVVQLSRVRRRRRAARVRPRGASFHEEASRRGVRSEARSRVRQSRGGFARVGGEVGGGGGTREDLGVVRARGGSRARRGRGGGGFGRTRGKASVGAARGSGGG